MSNELAELPAEIETPVATDEAAPESTVTSAAENADAPTEGDKPDDTAEKKEPSEAEKIRYAMQKRIDQLFAQRSEAERRAREAEEKVKSLAPAPIDDAPKEEDFQTYEEYLKAVGKHEAKKEFEAKQTEAKRLEMQQAQAKEIEAKRLEFEAKEAEYRKDVPDYDDTVQVLNEAIASVDHRSAEFQAFREVLLSSDNMPALSYHLGKNPELIDELQTLKPVQIARKLFALEMSLGKTPKKTATPLPPPVKSVSGKGNSNKSLNDMTPAEIEAWRKAK